MASGLIRKADLFKRIDEWQQVLMPRFELRDGIIFDTLESVNWHIDDLPTVDAVEVVYGEWIKSDSMLRSAKCSECNCWITKHTINENWFRFCPNCGAKMDGKEIKNE